MAAVERRDTDQAGYPGESAESRVGVLARWLGEGDSPSEGLAIARSGAAWRQPGSFASIRASLT
jgi:hypothetical protein